VAGRPPSFPPGTAWSYSNTGYILLGLLVETAGGATLAQELQWRIVEPLGLRSTYLPGDARELPEPMSRGYSLPVGPRGEVLDGPLLDFTAQNPSWAWAAGALVSDLEDLVGFFRALLEGRLLPPGLLAEMLSTVPVPPGSIPLPLPLYDRYGLGLLEMGTPAGRLVGQLGGIPGYLSMVLSTPDGRRQLGVMGNVLVAPDAMYEAFLRVVRELSPAEVSGGGRAWRLGRRTPTHWRGRDRAPRRAGVPGRGACGRRPARPCRPP